MNLPHRKEEFWSKVQFRERRKLFSFFFDLKILFLIRNFFLQYSKALRCTFFGERKKSCSSKFVQLLLLNRVKARWTENHAAQGFRFINSFISNSFGPNSKTCTCEVRAVRGRVSQGLTVLPLYFRGNNIPEQNSKSF